jgi:hypothetical protein
LTRAEAALGYSSRSEEPRTPWIDPYSPADEFGYEYRGMGGVVSNVIDLRRWIHALQTDTVLTDASRVKLFARYREKYACGWEAFEFDDGMRCIGHGGSVRGYVSKLWWFPDDGALLIVLSNNDAFDYSLLNALRDVLFPPGESVKEPPGRNAVDAWVAKEGHGKEYAWNILPSVRLQLVHDENALQGNLIVPSAECETSEDPQSLRAAEIVRAIARGDTQLLAEAMDPSIPTSWPGRMEKSIWPQHVGRRGSLKSVKLLGVSSVPGKPSDGKAVWLLLDHERGNCLGMVGYRSTGSLQLLMLDVAHWLHLDRDRFAATGKSTYECRNDGRHVTLSISDEVVRVKTDNFFIRFTPVKEPGLPRP